MRESRLSDIRHFRAARWWRGGAVTLAYCLATVIMTWPFAARLASTTPGGADPLLQIWVARWVQHALVTDPLHPFNANIFHPYGHTLAYSDANMPAALLAAPLYLLTGDALLAINLLVLGTFVLAAGGAYALVGALLDNRAAAFLAGLAYAFLPYRFAHLWHLNQLGHAWTPWVALELVLLIRRQTRRAALLFGGLFGVQAVTSFYVAFQIALVVALALVVAVVADPRTRTRRFGLLLAAGGLVAAAIIVPLALPYLAVREEQGFERTVREAEAFQAPPASYLTVLPQHRFWGGLRHTTAHNEDILFPGGLALLGAAVGLCGWRRRPALTGLALALAGTAFVIALGPTWRPERGGTTPLPYRFLFEHFPFFKALRVPARFGVLVDAAIILLAGCGTAWAWERLAARRPAAAVRTLGAALTAILTLGLLVELHAAPPLSPVDRGAVAAAPYRWLAQQADNGAVMEFPATTSRRPGETDEHTALAMYWSTLYWKPLVQGYSGFAPRGYHDALRLFSGDLARPDGTRAARVSHVNATNVGVLQELGVRYLVLHRDRYAPADWPGVLAQLAATGRADPAGDFGATVIYTLRERDPGAPTPALDLALVAPALVRAGEFWEPTVIARNTGGQLGLLTRGRPLRLTTTWRDAAGRRVRRDTLSLGFPALIPPGALYCSIRLCPAAVGVSAPEPTPGPPPVRLYPDRPGRYTVELALTGDRTIARTLTVEVTAEPTAAAEDGPPLALVDATVTTDEVGPGGVVGVVLAWEVRARPSEDYTLFAQLLGPDGQVRGQYDAPAGWTSHYTSAWSPGERVALPWVVPLDAGAPPGPYRLLVGMYRHTATGVERVALRYPGGDATEYWAREFTVR